MESLHPNLRRAFLLLEQKRYADAEKELKKALADDPQNATIYAVLAECAIQQDHLAEALEMAKQALNLDAGNAYHHSVLAVAYMANRDLTAAKAAIEEAISLDPYDAHYYFLRGNIAYAQKKWDFALINANKALEIDAESVNAINLRSMALTKLNRKDEASATADFALHKEPENPYAHANKGWTEIERGNHKSAQQHFREALRLDPMNEVARSGLKESIKSQNFLYRQILNYFLWMGKMSERNQWVFIIGIYALVQLAAWVAENYPAFAPFLDPLIIVYVILAFSTWIAMPVSNLFLRLHPLGKYALTSDEKLASNVVGSLLFGCLTGFSMYFLGLGELFMLLGGWCGFMALPVGGTFGAEKGTKGRKILTAMTIGIGLCGLLGIFLEMSVLINAALIGIFAFGWVSNGISIRS